MQLGRRFEATFQTAKGTFDVLAERDFRWYWLSSFAYYAGIQTDAIARGWLAYQLSGSALLLGVVTASQGVPQTLMALMGGLLADRISKRRVLLGAQLVLSIGAFCTAILVSTGLIQLYMVAVLALVQGAAVGLSLPGRLAFVSNIVPRERFLRAYGLYYVALNTMRIIAPAVGGILIGVIGTGGLFYLIGTAHALSLISLLSIREDGRPAARPKSSLRQDFVEMFSYARRNKTIPILMGLDLLFGFFGQSVTNLMPVFAVTVFNVGSSGLGALMASLGVGALLGSVTVASIGSFKRKPLLLLIIGMASGVASILFAGSPFFLLALFFLGASGFASASYLAMASALFQLNATDDMRSRVASLYMLGNALQPVAMLPIGGASDHIGAPFTVATCGALLITTMMLFSVLLPGFRKMRL